MMRQFHKYRTSGIFALIFFFRDKFSNTINNTCNYHIGYYLLKPSLFKKLQNISKQILNVYTFSFIFAKSVHRKNTDFIDFTNIQIKFGNSSQHSKILYTCSLKS